MATILLPAVRRETVNLYPPDAAGVVSSSENPLTAFAGGGESSPGRIYLSDAGLSPGDVISARCQAMNGAGRVRLVIAARDATGGTLQAAFSAYVDAQAFTDLAINGHTLPANTHSIFLRVESEAGGETFVRRGMINRGPTAQSHEWPKRGAWAPITHGQLVRDNEQFVQRYLSGASQITTFPSRRWLLQFATHTLKGDELREWSLALDRLSDLTNVFHFVPPEYTGPSTGYEGPLPVVNGAGQLGTSLDCNGVTPETDIVGPGDYVSFPVTTSAGETNYELHRISSLCTSDESGEVTLEFTRPIRLAPANNAVVQIYSPIGQFRLAVPRAGQDIQLLRRASVSVEAEEAIWL